MLPRATAYGERSAAYGAERPVGGSPAAPDPPLQDGQAGGSDERICGGGRTQLATWWRGTGKRDDDALTRRSESLRRGRRQDRTTQVRACNPVDWSVVALAGPVGGARLLLPRPVEAIGQ
jgi:hypothetical protein